MESKTYILLGKVESTEREDFENIEGLVMTQEQIRAKDKDNVLVLSLSEFMDSCNSEEISLTDYWISYIYER